VTSPAPLVCPHCQAPLGLDAPAEPGARLTCPACGREIVVPGPSVVGESSIAGSDDDRAVTLVPSQDASTLTAARRAAADADVATEAWQRLLDADGAGRYVERGHIARGGMGEIVLCIDRNIRRPVAMKRILPETADDPSRRARFVEEAQVTGQLEHPNIVPVHELERAPDGTLYFTMKLVKGRSLADILQAIRAAGPLPPGEGARRSSPPGEQARAGEGAANAPEHSLADLLQIFLKVCDGVAFAHSRGVVHRDLKPANIMVGDFGEVLVMDWGLAKIVGREDIRAADLVTSDRLETTPELTLDGTALGTPAYMPPEQANGQLDKIDHRSDIYALGAILYEILTLEKPVEGETPLVVLANAAHGQIVPPEQRTPGRAVPRELSAIAMQCLHKLRSRRYQSVTDLQSDIRLYLEGRSVSAAPDTFAQAAVKLVKRNRRVSAAIAAAAVILLTMGAIFTWDNANKRKIAEGALAESRESERKAIEARHRQRETALASAKRFAMQAIRAAETGRRPEAERRAEDAELVAPGSPWAPYARGMFAKAESDYSKAAGFLRAALEADADHRESKAALSGVLAQMGQLADAEKMLAQVGTTTNWRALLGVGETLYRSRRWKQCQVIFARALELMQKERDAPRGVRATTAKEVEAKIARAKYTIDAARARAACEGFADEIAELPVTQQVKRINAKLCEIHGVKVQMYLLVIGNEELVAARFDHARGVLRFIYPLEGVPFRKLDFAGTLVEDLSPLRGMPLERLKLGGTRVRDLSLLQGLALRELDCSSTAVSDLTPLKGMPLVSLDCRHTPVSDLSPLVGMKLTHFSCHATRVTDLGPLRGMPLRSIGCGATAIADLEPLKGMQLESFDCGGNVHLSDLSPLKGMPLTSVNCYAAGRVHDLTPLRGSPLTDLRIGNTAVTDLSPLEGMPLTALDIGGIRVKSLAAVRGMPLRTLKIRGSRDIADLTPAAQSELRVLWMDGCSRISDLTPLAGLRLTSLTLTPKYITKGMEVIRQMPSIEQIRTGPTSLMSLKEFWRRYDAGEFRK